MNSICGLSPDYIPLEWDVEPPYEVVRGHVPLEYAVAVLAIEGINVGTARAIPRYARWIPAPPGYPYDLIFHLCDAGRGAFLVTVVEPEQED